MNHTRVGGSKGGTGGGKNDQRVVSNRDALQSARNNPDSTAADIAEKTENHNKALALQQKAHKGKSGGGKKGGKYSHYEQYFSLFYS